MSRSLKFAKMHGLGNDFMVVDAVNQPFQANAEQVRLWADRKSGIGFDQMLVVEPPRTGQAQFKYRIYNADGGEVSQCGNGARCFARFVREQGLTDKDLIAVETNAGLLELELLDGGRVRVNMGVPEFEPARIPLNTESRQIRYQFSHNDQIINYAAVAIGNPHMIIQVDDVDSAPVATLGPFFESHALFPERVNVGFMQIIDR
ncbi:MAG: diaminopimelate epimerase, partial [Planctomycetota bacterium]